MIIQFILMYALQISVYIFVGTFLLHKIVFVINAAIAMVSVTKSISKNNKDSISIINIIKIQIGSLLKSLPIMIGMITILLIMKNINEFEITQIRESIVISAIIVMFSSTRVVIATIVGIIVAIIKNKVKKGVAI